MSDNAYLKINKLKEALSQFKRKIEADIASAISTSSSNLNSSITSGDSSTLSSAKTYADILKTTLDTSISSALGEAKGYTDGAKTALETNINSYGVSGLSFDSQTSILTLTMKDNSTKTATITGNSSSGGSGSSSEITLASLGAAAATHTHTESDITDLGDYATNTDLNTYGVSSISFNDSTNVLSLGMKDGSTKTITIPTTGGGSSSSSSGNSSLFPTIQRNEIYSGDDIVMSSTNPTIYFQALNYGFSEYSDTIIESLSGLSFDPFNDYEFTKTSTDYERDLTTYSYYKPGSIFLDGFMIWITGDIMDGHQVGDIVFRAYDAYGQLSGYINLATGDASAFQITSSSDIVKINVKGIRLLKKYIDDKVWLKVGSNDLTGYILSSSISLSKNSSSTNNFLFEINLSLYNATPNIFDTITTNYGSNSDIALLLHFGTIQILKQYLSDPLSIFYGGTELIQNITYLSSFDVSQFNSTYNLSYTTQEYQDFTNELIDTINNALITSGTSFSLTFKINSLTNYYPKMVNYQDATLINTFNLPNYSDSTTDTVNNIGLIPYIKY